MSSDLTPINQVPENFKCEIIFITPDWCLKYLTDEDIQSAHKDYYTQELANKISSNEYIINGSPIIISDTGKLLSGKEILNAVVIANKGVEHVVSMNIPDEYYKTIDLFTPRKSEDEISIYNKLHLEGQDIDSFNINKAILIILKCKTGSFEHNYKSSPDDLLAFYINKRPVLLETMKIFKDYFKCNDRKTLPISIDMLTAMKYLFDLVDTQKSNDFFNILLDYKEISDENNAVIRFKKHILKIYAEKKLVMKNELRPIKRNDYIFWIISAWNSFYVGKPVERIVNPQININERTQKTTTIYNISIKGALKFNQYFENINDGEDFKSIQPLGKKLTPKIDIILMTPRIALNILENHNNSNRKIKMRTVNRYINEMTSGKWLFNGETIKFSSTGEVLDAQHRLRACVASGQSFYVIKVSNIDPSAFSTYDTKKTNNIKNVLLRIINNDTDNDDMINNFVKKHINGTVSLLCKYENKNYAFRPTPSDCASVLTDNIDILDTIMALEDQGKRREYSTSEFLINIQEVVVNKIVKILMVPALAFSMLSSAMAKDTSVAYDVATYGIPDSKRPHKMSLAEISSIDKSKWQLLDMRTVIVSDDKNLSQLHGDEKLLEAGQDENSHNIVRVISRHHSSR